MASIPPESHPLPTTLSLSEAVAASLPQAIPWSGTVYRFATPNRANVLDFVSGEGAKHADGRWTLAEWKIAAVNTSLDPFTAQREAFARINYFRLPLVGGLPMVLGGAKVQLEKVLDLTNGDILRGFGVEIDQICELDWRKFRDRGELAFTHVIGREAYRAGFDGFLAPSAAARPYGGGSNLIYFPGRLSVPAEVINPENMPDKPSPSPGR